MSDDETAETAPGDDLPDPRRTDEGVETYSLSVESLKETLTAWKDLLTRRDT